MQESKPRRQFGGWERVLSDVFQGHAKLVFQFQLSRYFQEQRSEIWVSILNMNRSEFASDKRDIPQFSKVIYH